MRRLSAEKFICLAVILMSATGFLWVFIDSYLAWKETGINVLVANAKGLASIAGVGILFAAALVAIKIKERQTREKRELSKGVDQNCL